MQSHQQPPTTMKIMTTVRIPAPARSAVVITFAEDPPGGTDGFVPAPAFPLDVPPEAAVKGAIAGVMRLAPIICKAHI
jgi:hypothetical protein